MQPTVGSTALSLATSSLFTPFMLAPARIVPHERQQPVIPEAPVWGGGHDALDGHIAERKMSRVTLNQECLRPHPRLQNHHRPGLA